MGGELPFIYGENQIQSVVAPAIGAIADGMLMETPAVRKTRKKKNEAPVPPSNGRVDYECFYRQIAYLIELKHDAIGSRHYLTKSFKTSWKTVCEQIRNIKPTLAKDYKRYNDNCIRIALQTAYVKVNQKADTLENRLLDEMLQDIIADIQGLSPAPNWVAVWKVHSNWTGPFYGETQTKHIFYPALIFIARIEE